MKKIIYWTSILGKKNKDKDQLIFIHTPKCSGTYISEILKDLKIYNKEHRQAIQNEGINFTVIRDPIERFESLLNYRLDESCPREDWPKHLYYVYNDKSINLNDIVNMMSDKDIVSFVPYRSLTYWSTNIDIIITVDQLHEFLKFMATGRGKNRMDSSGKNKERNNDTVFNLICIVSSNTDFKTVIFDKNAKSSGEMARFLQIKIDEDKSMNKEQADEYFDLLFENYGHAGEIYSQWIIANLEAVKVALKETQIAIDKAWDITSKERKYSATLAAVFLGAKIARQLGIHNIDPLPVQEAVRKALESSRVDLKTRDFDAMETLTSFLHENLKNTLVINSITDSRSGLQEAPILKPFNELRVRIEPDTKTIYIGVGTISAYLKQLGNVEYEDFVKKLKDANVLKPRSGDLKVLHKGLDISGAAKRCLWIDNSTFDDIKLDNLPLDVPRHVH
jgi:hypothetical protein